MSLTVCTKQPQFEDIQHLLSKRPYRKSTRVLSSIYNARLRVLAKTRCPPAWWFSDGEEKPF